MNRTALAYVLATTVALLATVSFPGCAKAQEPGKSTSTAAPFSIPANYVKHEYLIPMRDGVKLLTNVYVPKDAAKTYPILLQRTPYSVGPYGEKTYPFSLGPSRAFAEDGYIFAYQDVRGKFMSEGDFLDVRPYKAKKGPKDADESSDTWDTIDWLIKNVSGNNGRVGMWGISYPGFYTSAGAIDSHPALKAVSPQAPVSNWFLGDDDHHNGAFFAMDALFFYNGFGRARPAPTTKGASGTPLDVNGDAYNFFLKVGALLHVNERYLKHEVGYWDDLLAHPNYDAFWQARDITRNLKNIHAAVLTVGGWFDAEDLWGTLHTYQAIEKQNPGIANRLVMGPWTHGGWAGGNGDHLSDISFGGPTAPYFRDTIQKPFFDFYLKDKGTFAASEATVFVTGTNQWRGFEQWPPRSAKKQSLFLQSGGVLGGTEEGSVSGATAAFDEYVSDPAHPVPYTPETLPRRTTEYMIRDQRFAAERHDVMTYQTAPLTENKTIAGPITAKLWVSTTGSDADFVVKVIDVFPSDAQSSGPNGTVSLAGYQMLVRAEVMRARFRKSFEKPEALPTGKVVPVTFELPDVCHSFQKGHRVMVQVQSSWFPLVDRNPQKFVPNIYLATDADFQKATHRLYHTPTFPSQIVVGVIPEEK